MKEEDTMEMELTQPGTAAEMEVPCPVAATAEIIGRKWVALILRDLSYGTQRFGMLQQSLQVSPRVLSGRLQELENEGFVRRVIFAEVPPRVEYSLTEKGLLFVPLIEEMRRVGRNFIVKE
jgi:DNA-binding HxlR family transcriptional regulator